MDNEKKVSDARAAIMAGTALVLGAFYVFFGVDWYNKGRLVMCYCELSVDPNSWCYRPDDPPSGNTSATPLPRYEPSTPPSTSPRLDTGNNFTNSLGIINRCYKGTTASHEYENSYSHRFDLWWNSMFLTDDNRRAALASIVTAFYVAFLGFTASVLKDWFVSK
jgi:hypothetical protein